MLFFATFRDLLFNLSSLRVLAPWREELFLRRTARSLRRDGGMSARGACSVKGFRRSLREAEVPVAGQAGAVGVEKLASSPGRARAASRYRTGPAPISNSPPVPSHGEVERNMGPLQQHMEARPSARRIGTVRRGAQGGGAQQKKERTLSAPVQCGTCLTSFQAGKWGSQSHSFSGSPRTGSPVTRRDFGIGAGPGRLSVPADDFQSSGTPMAI